MRIKMQKTTPLFLSALIATIPVVGMEHNIKFDLSKLPDEAAIAVVAACQNKNALRQTCKRFSTFASRIKNENILTQTSLHLTQEALDRYLLYYSALDNTAIVNNLLAKGANPNMCEDNGTVPTRLQCDYDDYNDIKNSLLEDQLLGRKVITKAEKFCPLCQATKCTYLMKFLISNGAQVNCDDYMTPLHRAAYAGDTSAVQLLIDHGANVHIEDFLGYTALHYASGHGHIQIVKMLLENGADVNIKNRDGATPLHHGSLDVHNRIDKVGVIEILLQNGARINECDISRLTPLDFTENQDIKDCLIAHGGKKRRQLEEQPGCIIQ